MSTQPPTRFGQELLRLRTAAGLTQQELADRAGLSVRGIADLERGVRRSPYSATVQRLTQGLNLTMSEGARLAAAGRPLGQASPDSLVITGISLPRTSLIGRERELAELQRLLTETRLLTLTGVGGVGKTRLAFELAATVAHDCADGAAAVELAALADPSLVARAVGLAIGLGDRPGRSALEILVEALRTRQMLLVLDNCEHLLEACAELTEDLLRACPELRILATSRAPLRLAGEAVWEVPPLSLPASATTINRTELVRSEAARLFLHRARTIQPRFALNDVSAPIVAQLCIRLDGIPLALELAAGRVRTLSVHDMVTRLDDRFQMLTGGSRVAPPHQQTLLATLDWSYDLLAQVERDVFASLSVFAGGCTAAALESVCAGHADLLDVVGHLVDQSLVMAEPTRTGPMRYRLLETLREYARQHLDRSPTALAVRQKHATHFLEVAEQAETMLQGPEQAMYLAMLDEEHDNMRAAWRWFMDRGSVEPALRLAAALARYWDMRGHLVEGRARLTEALDASGGRPSQVRLRAILAAVRLAWRYADFAAVDALVDLGLELEREVDDPASAARLLNARAVVRDQQGDYPAARALHEQILTVWRRLGDPAGLAQTLNNLAILCDHQGDTAAAQAAYTECIAVAKETGEVRTAASALNNLGLVLHHIGNDAAARPLLSESLALSRELGDQYGIANTLASLGLVAHQASDLAEARSLFEQALAIRRDTGDRRGVAVSLQNIGSVLLDQGKYTAAEALLEESLSINRDLGTLKAIPDVLEALAGVAAAQSDHARALRLADESAAAREALGSPIPPVQKVRLERWLKKAL